ncbi:MAG: DUF11 domain-containing protein [Actinomycetota bacterium]|nr:DUF11 domain-containing protein [Actinomycetota bacterium]
MPIRLFLTAAAVLLALPTTASAAVSLGQTAGSGGTCDADATIAQVGSEAPGYTVPSAGVITQLRTEDVTADGRFLHVFRPRGNDSYTILAAVEVTPDDGVIAIPARVPVQPGDVLGLSTGAAPDPHPNCTIPNSTGASASPHDVVAARNPSAAENREVTLPDADLGRLNVGATLEPDGDGDGFGDETQDRCPDDRTRTAEACSADLVVSQLPVEPDVERDDVNVVTIFVRNNGTSLARDVRVTEPLPPGVQLVTTVPTSGGCAGGAPVDCTFPALAAGETASVLVIVKAISLGRKSLTATVGSPTPDPNGANNVAEIVFDVSARRSVVEPGAFCRVPRLTGLTRTAARSALEASGCRLGRTSYKRFRRGVRRGRVQAQSIPARTRVATRTRVNIVIRRR